jgi:hypothetical protein
MRNMFARSLVSPLLVLSLIGSPSAVQPAHAQSTPPVLSYSNYVLLPNPTAEPIGEQSPPRVTVELGVPAISSSSPLERWGDAHWLAELTLNSGGKTIWLSVEKSRFEPESFVYGLSAQLVSIGRGRTAHWDGAGLRWSEFPFRFDVVTANRIDALRIAQSFRSVEGMPRLQTPAGYETDGLHSVTSLREGIRVRSKLTFHKASGGLTETMLEGDPLALQKFARALAVFPQYPYNFTYGFHFRSVASWTGGRSIGHWKMWFEEPGLLVFLEESKFVFEDVENWVRTPILKLDPSVELKINTAPLGIPVDVWSFAERYFAVRDNEGGLDAWLDSPKISDFPLLLVGRSGGTRWEIRRDSDGALMSRFGTNVVMIDGSLGLENGRVVHQEGWLTLGNSFQYVKAVEPRTGPWVLRVDGKPMRKVYPRKLRDGSLLIIVNGLAAPFPAAAPDVQIVGANE